MRRKEGWNLFQSTQLMVMLCHNLEFKAWSILTLLFGRLAENWRTIENSSRSHPKLVVTHAGDMMDCESTAEQNLASVVWVLFANEPQSTLDKFPKLLCKYGHQVTFSDFIINMHISMPGAIAWTGYMVEWARVEDGILLRGQSSGKRCKSVNRFIPKSELILWPRHHLEDLTCWVDVHPQWFFSRT